jgi:hypothetical protein
VNITDQLYILFPSCVSGFRGIGRSDKVGAEYSGAILLILSLGGCFKGDVSCSVYNLDSSVDDFGNSWVSHIVPSRV